MSVNSPLHSKSLTQLSGPSWVDYISSWVLHSDRNIGRNPASCPSLFGHFSVLHIPLCPTELCFVLLCLSSCIEIRHSWISIAPLLWNRVSIVPRLLTYFLRFSYTKCWPELRMCGNSGILATLRFRDQTSLDKRFRSVPYSKWFCLNPTRLFCQPSGKIIIYICIICLVSPLIRYLSVQRISISIAQERCDAVFSISY